MEKEYNPQLTTKMNLDIETALHRCRICHEYSTETISVYDQVTAGVSYLDITLKLINQLKFDGSRDEPLHICVPCAGMAETAYNCKAICEGADYKLECNEEIFIEEKVEAVKIENENAITFSSNRCKIEDESISNQRVYRDSSLSPTEHNYEKLVKHIKLEPATENNLELEGTNTNSSDFETIEKTENLTSNCSAFSLKEETEDEQMLETKNDTIEEALEIYFCKLCGKTFNRRRNFRRHSKVVHKLDKLPCDYCEYVPESPYDYSKHVEAEHADKKTISCNHCYKTFFEIRALKGHLLSQCDTKNYVCEFCGSKFDLKSRLIEHLKAHKQTKRFKCSECGQYYKHLNGLIASKKCEACVNKVGQVAWTVFACKICDKKFTQSSCLRRHNKVVHDLQDTSCYFCDFLPQSPDELTNHIAQEHADKRSLACRDCGKTFLELRILKTHLLIHKGIKNHICDVCGDKFASKSKLVEHIRTHTGEKPFGCSKCDGKFSHSSSLKKHMKTHECDSSDENKSDSVAGIYVCKMCNKQFRHRSTLRKHSKNIHNVIEISCYHCEYIPASSSDLAKHTEKLHADKKNLACDQCSRTFFEVQDLKVHLLFHDGIKNYECEICNYKCTTKSILIKHMRKHTGERPFQCSECGKAFTQNHSLKQHLANQICKVPSKKSIAKHAAEGIYSCKICDRKFTKSTALRSHTKTVHKINQTSCFFCDFMPDSSNNLGKHMEKEHADKRTIACEHCDKAFFEIGHLQRHLIVHSSIKNYGCNICGHTFAMESYLTEHMTIHTGEKHFKCSLCDKSFRLQTGLKRHIGTHSDLAK